MTPAPYNEPPWMVTARTMLGLREIPGAKTAPFIAAMLLKLKAWWSDDETPWCGSFVAYCLTDCGLAVPSAWYRAKAYAAFGLELPAYTGMSSPVPPYGTVCVMDRAGGGHVFFLVGIVKLSGRLWVYALGGNQDNQVCVRRYPLERVTAWRWPRDYNLPTSRPPLPIYAALMDGAGVDGSAA